MIRWFLASVLIVTAATLASAAETRLPSGIVVSDNIPSGDLPENVATMTAKEFRLWAVVYNAQQADKARNRHGDYLMGRTPPVTASITEGSSNSIMKIGGGYGAGGVGGAGGYLGYGQQFGNGGGYGGNGGMSMSQGNTISQTNTDKSRSYSITYPDHNDNGGGALIFINPYAYKNIVKQVKAQIARDAAYDAQTAD